MIIKSIQLENIRSFRNSEKPIIFNKGITLLKGDIRSGKSTILFAIEFGLFGLGKTNGKFLLRNHERKGSVTLVFEHDNVEYTVFRELIRNNKGIQQKKCYLSIGSEYETLSPTELKDRVLQILNFNEPYHINSQNIIFRYAIFTAQEEMKKIIEERTDVRLEILRRVFKIEGYKTAQKNSAVVSKKIREHISYLKGKKSGEEELRKKIDMEKEIIITETEKLNNFNIFFDNIEFELKEQKRICSKLEVKNREYERIDKKIIHIKGILTSLEDKIKGKQDAKKDLKNSIKEFKDKIMVIDKTKDPKITSVGISKIIYKLNHHLNLAKEKLQENQKRSSHIEEINKSIDSNELLIKRDAEDISNNDKMQSNISQKLNNLNLKIDKPIKDIISRLKNDKKLLLDEKSNQNFSLGKVKTVISNFEDLIYKGECPVCRTKIDAKKFMLDKNDAKSKIKGIKNKMENLDVKIENIDKEIEKIEEINNNIKEYMKCLNDSSKKYQKIFNLKREIEELRFEKQTLHVENEEKILKDMEKFEKDIRENIKLKEEYIKFENALSNNLWCNEQIDSQKNKIMSLNEEINSMKEKYDNKREELTSFERKLYSLQNVKKEYVNNKKLIDLIKDIQSILLQNQSSLMTKIKYLNEEFAGYKEKMKEIKIYKEKQRRLEETLLWINDFFIPSLENIEKHMMEAIRYRFEKQVRGLYSLLIEDPEFQISINETFDPILERDGLTQSYSQLSGGERTSIALAYRLALNKIVQEESKSDNNHLLILDEPTDGFSKEQLSKIRIILDELNCPQVIIVSHDNEMEGIADHIYRVNNSSGNSSIYLH